MGKQFTKLAYDSVDDFIYGKCPNPVTCKNGMVIGGGILYPEVNFTLPAMNATEDTLEDAKRIYQEIITGVLEKARQLHAPGLVIEFETLPQYTENPDWGIEIHKILRNTMYEYEEKYGLRSALRMTPNDLREMNRPPIMRSGQYWESMVKIFEQTAKDGADFLAIESTGGKEINDEAIVSADLRTSVFALGCLGARDMKWLWTNISKIANDNGAIPAGDSACGFANTAMVLAEQGFIPKVYAAVADLWSNESVQQVKLLSGFAPVVSTEQLIYDCRLMNKAAELGHAKLMRDLLVESDCFLDPQAYMLKPEVVFEIAGEIVKTQDPFIRTLNTAKLSLDILQRAVDKKELELDEREENWLDMLRDQVDEIPEDEEAFIAEMKDELDDTKYRPEEYGI